MNKCLRSQTTANPKTDSASALPEMIGRNAISRLRQPTQINACTFTESKRIFSTAHANPLNMRRGNEGMFGVLGVRSSDDLHQMGYSVRLYLLGGWL